MNLRVRGPKGQFTLSGVDPALTISDFKRVLQEKSDIASEKLEIMSGFPPTVLQIPDSASSIGSVGLQNGDSLVVREQHTINAPAQPAWGARWPEANEGNVPGRNGDLGDVDEDEQLARALAASMQDADSRTVAPPAQNASTVESGQHRPAGRHNGASTPSHSQHALKQAVPAGGAPNAVAIRDGSAVARRIIESDNSCLFNAVGYVMEGSRNRSQRLREVIADTVRQDPETYTEGYLEKSSKEYQQWIQDPKRWGGAIELSILSRFYGREIAAYDIQTKRVDVYGQADGYTERALLLYDGLHYDAMAQTAFEGAPEELDITIFQTAASSFAAVKKAADQLVSACHEARQFTDTGNFTLRCGVCQIGVKGEKEAVQHAKETGHQSFQEYH